MPDEGHRGDRLNEAQCRRLVSTCRHIDQVLSELEGTLTAAASRSPFGKYVDDLTPAQKKVFADSLDRIRRQMMRALAAQHIELPRPDIGALWAIRTSLHFVDIAIEELRPHHMRGYGAVDPGAAAVLTGTVEELQTAVRQLEASLAQGPAGDFSSRLERLSAVGSEADALRVLHGIIDRYALVEFRRPFGIILDRLDDPKFEIAVFGRVSTGKSSLLDRLLETDVLPIGVNPMTSVPTRIVYGRVPKVVVAFADAASQTLSIRSLPEFVTEEHNPANARHVTRVVVELNFVLDAVSQV